MNPESNRRLLSVTQAAEYLGLSPKTVYSWVESGRIPYVALGRRRMLDTRELERFIRENTTTPWDKSEDGKTKQLREKR